MNTLVNCIILTDEFGIQINELDYIELSLEMRWRFQFFLQFVFQHLFISLSELQIKREEEIARHPLSQVCGHWFY